MIKPIDLVYIDNDTISKKKKSIFFSPVRQCFREVPLFQAALGSKKYLSLFVVDTNSNAKHTIENLVNSNLKLIPPHILSDIHKNKTKLIILFMFEGYVYNGKLQNEYNILNEWCKKHNFKSDQVYYLHENFNQDLLPDNLHFTLRSFTTFFCWLQQDKMTDLEFTPKDTQYLYLLYNRANRIHRWVLGTQLFQRDLIKMGKCSYEILGPDKQSMSKWFGIYPGLSDLVPSVQSFEKTCPILLDYSSLVNNNPVNMINQYHHETTFMSIVTETLYRGELFFSEKIWKPVMAGQPFMLLGSPGLLKMFKSWKFKTFDNWFDESYDDITDMRKRSEAIVQEVERLSNLSIDQLKSIRKEMLPVLQHNQQRYAELRSRMCYPINNSTPTETGIKYLWNFHKTPEVEIQKIWHEWVDESSINNYNNFL